MSFLSKPIFVVNMNIKQIFSQCTVAWNNIVATHRELSTLFTGNIQCQALPRQFCAAVEEFLSTAALGGNHSIYKTEKL